MRKEVMISLIMVVIVTLAAIPGYARADGSRNSSSYNPYSSIEMRSVPPGASLFVDGVFQGMTPCTINVAPLSDHKILLRKEGYEDLATPFSEDGIVIREYTMVPVRVVQTIHGEKKVMNASLAEIPESTTLSTTVQKTMDTWTPPPLTRTTDFPALSLPAALTAAALLAGLARRRAR